MNKTFHPKLKSINDLINIFKVYLIEESVVGFYHCFILQPDFHSEAFLLTGNSIFMGSIDIALVVLELPGL